MREIVLVIAAHPDDEILGCGGTMAKHVQAGDEVHIAILGEGITSRYTQRERAPKEELEELKACSRNAAKLVGVQRVSFYDLPDNRFDTLPLLDVVKLVERIVGDIKPTLVYTQHGGDMNIDHAMVFRATMTATRPVESNPVRELLAYEVASSTEYAFRRFSPPFNPNVFVDITPHLEAKIRAMEAYKGEARTFPHPRSSEAIRAQAHKWGAGMGQVASEAFESIWRRY